MKRRYRLLVVLVLFIYLFVFTSIFVESRANVALSIQERSFSRKELLDDRGYKLDLPLMEGWNEKIRLYQSQIEDRKLDIYYNYGSYEKGRSIFYDKDSPFYNSHYGLYVIEGSYGLDNLDQVERLIKKDQLNLVMGSLGIERKDKFLSYSISSMEDSTLEASIRTNGPLHKKKEKLLGYLQYGSPPRDYDQEDFPLVDMLGKIKIDYDQDLDVTYIFFVITREEELLREIFDDLVIKTKIMLVA